MRTRLAAVVLLLLAACGRPPVRDEVTVEFFEDRPEIEVTATTRFDTGSSLQRVEAARAAALAGIDPWTTRLNRLSPKVEEVTFARRDGELERVTRSVVIPAEDLQRVFSDASITVSLIDGEGWRELSFYPGTSTRATREQTRLFEAQLHSWSTDVARYFTAIDHLYDYLGENPHRAEFVFAALVGPKDSPVLEDEEPLVRAVVESMERIADRMDDEGERAVTFAEVADLVYNPFPARIVVRVPREKDLVIEPVDLFAAIAALEGRWISPDPLAALLKEEAPTAEQLARLPRQSANIVSAGEIAGAIREQLARPRTYSIRWVATADSARCCASPHLPPALHADGPRAAQRARVSRHSD